MKKLCILLFVTFFYGSADAGLFEYTLGERTNINASPTSSAGTVESLDYNVYQGDTNTQGNFNTFSNYSNSQDAYYDSVSRGSGDDLQYFYIQELEKLETESYFIDDIRKQVQVTIRDLDNTNTRFYYDLIQSLAEIQDREEFVDALIDDYRHIVHTGYDRNNDLVYTLTNLGTYDTSYNFNRRSNYDRYNSNSYSRPRFSSLSYNSYNKGSYYTNGYNTSPGYNNYRYYDDIYDNNYYSYSQSRSYGNSPSWVNPYLSESGEGYVYIR